MSGFLEWHKDDIKCQKCGTVFPADFVEDTTIEENSSTVIVELMDRAICPGCGFIMTDEILNNQQKKESN
jgi:ribosomal protein S27AE